MEKVEVWGLKWHRENRSVAVVLVDGGGRDVVAMLRLKVVRKVGSCSKGEGGGELGCIKCIVYTVVCCLSLSVVGMLRVKVREEVCMAA